uniref:DUF4939 domain-containing protein n=1 Tax=Cyprinodon variegatus TaxID=28743 RepID=A0A3Q2E3V4_CYPVA
QVADLQIPTVPPLNDRLLAVQRKWTGRIPLLRSESVPSLPDFRPSLFSGESSECKSFLWQCKLFFELNSSSFPNDEKKIIFVLSLLSGKACEWKETFFPSESTITYFRVRATASGWSDAVSPL